VSAERTAFLGLGIMGWPQAANLRAAGHQLTVWTRDPAKAQHFAEEHGATAAETPKDAAAQADVIITMLPDAPEVGAVIDRAEPPEGSLVVDMSTIRPTASRAIAERLAARGVSFLDAPVTGSRPKAEEGTLTIMVGGETADLERARPLFEAMGQLVVHAGPHGHGSMIKLINNTLAAVNAAALAEGISLAQAAGVDVDAMEQVVGSGSGNSAMLELKAGPMREGDFEPLFKLEHMLKDVRHFLSEARDLGLDLEVAGSAETRYALAEAEGLGGKDFAAVISAIRR
jgi:3-hydroxyisobutyrate dehydrogenase-like beta-hydroxyacid dehydrogenase